MLILEEDLHFTYMQNITTFTGTIRVNSFLSMKTTEDNNTDNRHLLLWLSIAGSIISGLSLIINLQLSIQQPLIVITIASLILFLILAIFIKRGLNLRISQYLVIITSIAFTNLLWYFEHGHYGPSLTLFVLVFSVILFIWEGRLLIVSVSLLIINIGICFYIEFYYPELIQDYNNHTTRIIDIYASVFMMLILFYALMRTVKTSYSKEYKKAMQSDKLKSSFLENINHEVRTPLNAIIGFSGLINEDDITADQRKEFGVLIGESNDALLRIIDDILLVSTLESGEAPTNIHDCDLDVVIASLHKSFKELLVKNKKVNIELYISEPNVSSIVETDKIRLQQVFIRLMDNAIKFSDSGKINFGYKVVEDSILFHVADTGIGIEKKHHSKIFERFYKIEIDKDEVFRGTGIGLYITKKIVESLDGDIWLSSMFGSGTTFYFTIPKNGYRKK